MARVRRPGTQDFKDFTFDAVYDHTTVQANFYDAIGYPVVESVLDGYNGTMFAYGQTGTGKTHTMVGPAAPEEQHGVIPRTFAHIFRSINTTTNKQFLVRASYLEIYNEEIRDLLSKNPKQKLDLKDHPDGGVFVKDLSNMIVKGVDDLNQVMEVGQKNRSVASTLMNSESSRSHSIFTITVETSETLGDKNHYRVGKMNMVDLAGSERQSKTGATGDVLKEATKINMSLSALGNVISALVDSKTSFVPYRDSKLTRLLQDSLGGNTKTVMVANLGPADYNYDETLSTLRYAHRAKSIKNKPKINEDPKDAMMRELQEEMMRLKAELAAAGDGMGGGDDVGGGAGGVKKPPKVEKKTEYVEKVVEKIVEREVVIEQGASAEEIAAMEAQLREQTEHFRLQAEQQKQQVAAQRDKTEEEKREMMAQIEAEERQLQEETQRKMAMAAKLQQMEQKMVAGKQVMEKAIEQEAELKKQQKRLRKQQEREADLKRKEEAQRQENIELETRCASQEEQVQKLTAKLKRIWDKYQKAQQEMVDIQHFNQSEREDMLSMIRDLKQQLKLKTLIMESFVPYKEIQSCQARAVWDADEDEWGLAPIAIDLETRPMRPVSALGLPRPTSQMARLRSLAEPNPRFLYDSILFNDLDLPERTTEDYEVHPEFGDRIERALVAALSPDEEDQRSRKGDERRGGDRPEAGRGSSRGPGERPQSGKRNRPSTASREAAFPQARGLVSRE
mmetsp:Transcript_108639/g.212859  ORF Transcript_108639/g.212859 Transcript_108639/m.212859 type:complete len:733 (-) Transcript_108639:308-2506(-)